MDESKSTDIKLMLQFCNGDEEAFGQLLQRNLPHVLHIIQHFVYSPNDAEDLAQEAFLRIYKARTHYSPDAEFQTWLYRIIANLCINHIRDNKRYTTTYASEEEQMLSIADTKQETPSHILVKTELRQKVKKALCCLPPNQRIAIILSKYENLSYQEIANAMDLSIAAVKSLLTRAKLNLKKYLLESVSSQSDLII